MNIDRYFSKQLKPGEEIIRIVRSYPLTLVPVVGGAAFLLLLDFFLLAWWAAHKGWGMIAFGIIAIIALFIGVRRWYVWSMNVFVVTNQRIIDIDQRGFFSRNVAEASYDKIQDVRYSVRGMWQTILSLGAIEVQTAGSTTNLELRGIKRPVELQQLITDSQRQAGVVMPPPVPVVSAPALDQLTQLRKQLGTDTVERLLRETDEHGRPR